MRHDAHLEMRAANPSEPSKIGHFPPIQTQGYGQHEFPVRFPKSRGNTFLWYEKIARKSSGTTYTPLPDQFKSNGFLMQLRLKAAFVCALLLRMETRRRSLTAETSSCHADVLANHPSPNRIPVALCSDPRSAIGGRFGDRPAALTMPHALRRPRKDQCITDDISPHTIIFLQFHIPYQPDCARSEFGIRAKWYFRGLAPHSPALSPPPSPTTLAAGWFTCTPVECTVDGYTEPKGGLVKPEAGDLLTRSHWNRDPEPWAYDIYANDTDLVTALMTPPVEDLPEHIAANNISSRHSQTASTSAVAPPSLSSSRLFLQAAHEHLKYDFL
ncbi:hypothetical protein C8J57DRAFT_1605500 [Mycena rebaudengoi]|nr:hypothetical protein C8J57DRAFT_1605500 [Mycena rebaudengoi]